MGGGTSLVALGEGKVDGPGDQVRHQPREDQTEVKDDGGETERRPEITRHIEIRGRVAVPNL